MDWLFVDTGAWLSLELYRDQHHAAAVSFAKEQAREFRWVTTNWVLSETLTLLRRRTTHAAAVRFGERLRSSKRIELARITQSQEERAWRVFIEYGDKDFGFVDCTSFAFMESLGIGHAFTFDKHFLQFGFQTLPG